MLFLVVTNATLIFFFSMSTGFKIQNKLISEQLLTKHAACILNMMKCVLSADLMLCEQIWVLSVFLSSGVFDNAFANPVMWLTALLTALTAVLPSMTARTLNVTLKVYDKHKVKHTYK